MFHPQGPTLFELLEQGLSSTTKGYDLLAGRFEYTPFRTPDAVLTRAAELVGQPGSVGTALDVCCNTGAALRAFAPLCRERIVGIDLSRAALAEARRLCCNLPGPARVEFVHGDVLTMPFAAEFDLAICFGAFGHFLPHEHMPLIARVARALKPGGRFVFATAENPSPWSREYWLRRLFNAVMHVRNLVLYPPFVMYYLGFPTSRAQALLTRAGFVVRVERRVFSEPYARLDLVIATKTAARSRPRPT